MKIQCMIEREGDTIVDFEKCRYTFAKNEKGHAVAEVQSPSHYNRLLAMKGCYKAYGVNPVPQGKPVPLEDDKDFEDHDDLDDEGTDEEIFDEIVPPAEGLLIGETTLKGLEEPVDFAQGKAEQEDRDKEGAGSKEEAIASALEQGKADQIERNNKIFALHMEQGLSAGKISKLEGITLTPSRISAIIAKMKEEKQQG